VLVEQLQRDPGQLMQRGQDQMVEKWRQPPVRLNGAARDLHIN